MRSAVEELAGKPVPNELDRLTPLRYWGWSEWTKRTPNGTQPESCYVEVTAQLTRSGRLQVATRNLECEPQPPTTA